MSFHKFLFVWDCAILCIDAIFKKTTLISLLTFDKHKNNLLNEIEFYISWIQNLFAS